MFGCLAVDTSGRRNGRSAEAEMWLGEMEASGMTPDVISFNTVINVCAHDGRPEEARLDVRHVESFKRLRSPGPNNRLFFCCQSWGTETKHGVVRHMAGASSWQHALSFYQDLRALRKADVKSFISAVSACKGPQWPRALQLLDELGEAADIVSLTSTMNSCEGSWQAALALLERSKHADLQVNVITYNSAMNILGKSSEWSRALLLLHDMQQEQIPPSLVSYNTAISACGRSSEWAPALSLLRLCQSADIISYNAAIHSCEESSMWELAMDLWQQIHVVSLQRSVTTFGVAISAAAQASRWENALQVLQELEESALQASLIHYNAAMRAFENNQLWVRALQLLEDCLDLELAPDIISFNTSVSACGKAGELAAVKALCAQLHDLGLQENLITFNALLNSFAVGAFWEEALDRLRHTPSGMKADLISFHATSNACVTGTQWARALDILESARRSQLHPNRISCTIALTACERARHWELALLWFQSFDGALDTAAFNAAASACADHWTQVMQLLSRMMKDEIAPNIRTYGTLISACRNGSEWTLALRFLSSLLESELEANHVVFNAAINACGRAEHWQEALETLFLMEQDRKQVLRQVVDKS